MVPYRQEASQPIESTSECPHPGSHLPVARVLFLQGTFLYVASLKEANSATSSSNATGREQSGLVRFKSTRTRGDGDAAVLLADTKETRAYM